MLGDLFTNFCRSERDKTEFEEGKLTTLWEKIVKLGDKGFRYGAMTCFQLAEVVVPRNLCPDTLGPYAEPFGYEG